MYNKIFINMQVRAADESRANTEVGVKRTDEDYIIDETSYLPGNK